MAGILARVVLFWRESWWLCSWSLSWRLGNNQASSTLLEAKERVAETIEMEIT